MYASHANSCQAPFILALESLPSVQLKEHEESAVQIASHIRQMLESYGVGHPTTLTIPSCMELADFYQRTALDVLDALFCLKEQQFQYRMNGLDSEITLYDPIGRRNNHDVACGWAYKPHELPHRDAEHHGSRKNIFSSLFNYKDA